MKAGERRRILHLMFDSIPQRIRFSTSASADNGPVSGTVEVVGSRWLFRKPPVHRPLASTNALEKGFWDSVYSVHVTPDQDVTITLESRHFASKYLLLALAAVIVLAVGSAVVVPLLRG